MTENPSARRLKRSVIAGLVVVAAVLTALSPQFGRATPSGEYRPPLPPDALSNGCYPLPAGVEFGFPYQVRTDGDVGGRRILVIQYDLIDLEDAVRGLENSFLVAGFDRTDDQPTELGFTKPGVGEVNAAVASLDPLTDDQIVRGTITLDLPVVERQSDDPVCFDVTSTKRFPPPTEDAAP